MIFFVFLTGGLAGLWIRHYLSTLRFSLSKETYDAYIEIFPENPPHFPGPSQNLPPIKCGRFRLCFLLIGGIFALFYYCSSSLYVTASAGIFSVCCYLISVTDWHYRLISPGLCQLLLAGAVLSAWRGVGPVSLDEALESVLIAWSIFYGLFYIARFIYRREAFGRGDYWLISALAGFVRWQELPLFIFLSCLFALAYSLCYGRQKRFVSGIPFGPFLCLGMTALLCKNWVASGML